MKHTTINNIMQSFCSIHEAICTVILQIVLFFFRESNVQESNYLTYLPHYYHPMLAALLLTITFLSDCYFAWSVQF